MCVKSDRTVNVNLEDFVCFRRFRNQANRQLKSLSLSVRTHENIRELSTVLLDLIAENVTVVCRDISVFIYVGQF